MNTANLQLEGLYVAIASIASALVTKGVLTREELDGVLTGAERTALEHYRAETLSDANRDAMAFPARLLRLMSNSASETEIPRFSEMAKLVGRVREHPSDAEG